MPRGTMIHAMHQINDFNETYMENKYDISEEQYYYGSNKRKRKTAAPQKREPPEETCENDVKMLLKNPSFGAMNLVSKENNPSSLSSTEHSLNASNDGFINTSPEHIRLYTAMLNYFLSKCRSNTDCKVGSFPTYAPNTDVNHGFEKTFNSTFTSNLSHFFSTNQLSQNANPLAFMSSEHSPINGFHNEAPYCSNSKEFDSIYKNILSKYGAYLDWRQAVMNSISTCITNIPVPKSGFPNYEAMSACYKSLIDRAYALQQSVELYFRMIQNCLSYDPVPCPNMNNVSMSPPARNDVWSGPNNSIHSFSSQPLCTSSSYSTVNLSAVLTDILQTSNSTLSSQELPDGQKQVSGVMFAHNNQPPCTYMPTCQTQNSLQSPVDLTNSDRNKPAIASISVSSQANEVRAHRSDRSNKENSYDYAVHDEPDIYDLVCKPEHSRIPTVERDGDFTFSNSGDHDSVTNVDSRNGFVPQNPKHSAENMLCSSVISCPSRPNVNIRKKSYFKTKRMKKSFGSTSMPNPTNICTESSSPKKSNFRGTSEEENKVAPNFKPIEVNSQILLSEAHPNVKLSKDIFYSLIVKSSGSATRLIRLLMKSFFTQDELAASSLSGEGIYKQRLEPSVTEAIKIFIRQRHPQLKTGSINLCMTDVCVQARRVANNQRSRQHPLHISPSRQELTKSHGNNSTDQYECESLLGIKNRMNNSIRSISTGKLSKYNHESIIMTTVTTTTTTTSSSSSSTSPQQQTLMNPLINEYESNYCIEIPKTEINDTGFIESENDESILHIVDDGHDLCSDEIDTPASCSVHSFISDQK
ncbi:unnamed protein product [Heterobilharzia americana]|nr:unnamed protein product [Heterobilharzia americana]